MNYITRTMQMLKHQNCPTDSNFFNAVKEVLESIEPVISSKERYSNDNLLKRIVTPNREIRFKINWLNDKNEIETNMGYRVQFNNALGPYKGGTRFSSDVTFDTFKFLAFEQTFKNALTQQHIGGAKGGADFSPRGRSQFEVMKFCQAFMTELYNSLGEDSDILGGDIGVGSREVGYLFGQYKKLTNSNRSIITSKPLSLGGSLGRTQATGYGLIYFAQEMIMDIKKETLSGKICTVSGAGNVAIHAIEKLYQLGAIPVTCSDSKGSIYDKNGINLELLKDIKLNKRGSLKSYIDIVKDAEYVLKEDDSDFVWSIPSYAAFPCATQNELDLEAAKLLVKNSTTLIAEGANMPTTPDAIEYIAKSDIYFAPAKAANAGGVAISVLEMSQNASFLYLDFKTIDERLKGIMCDIYKDVSQTAKEYGKDNNLIDGANMLGFVRVADAMIAEGI
jgi:glutamate dehydrogenase (NADP+)